MNTTIKTDSEQQFNQFRRFLKKNKICYNITEENGLYIIQLFGLTSAETEKFLKLFTQTNHLAKVPQEPIEPQEPKEQQEQQEPAA